jgi:hypothetical protein
MRKTYGQIKNFFKVEWLSVFSKLSKWTFINYISEKWLCHIGRRMELFGHQPSCTENMEHRAELVNKFANALGHNHIAAHAIRW